MKKLSFHFPKQVWKYLIRPYWTSTEKWRALALLGGHIVFLFAYIGTTVRLNYWFNDFFSAVQNYNLPVFLKLLGVFAPWSVAAILLFMAKNYLLAHLEVMWRRWMTNYFLKTWMTDKRYYRLQLMEERNDNPDQRIAEDIHLFINTTVVHFLTLLQHIVTLVTFFSILWSLMGALPITIGGTAFHIPGYMCWGAILYAIFGTLCSFYFGKGLTKLDYEREKVEADFRYSLVRFRENTESIALYRGEEKEARIFMSRFEPIRQNVLATIKRMMVMNSWLSFFSQAESIIPYLFAAPVYFCKLVTFGTLMQAISAFARVSNALTFIVDKFTALASWKATTTRLVEFSRLLDMDPTSGFVRLPHNDRMLKVACDHIALPQGEILQQDIHFAVQPGQHTLILGRTGAGKSTLARVLSGLWPYGRGEIHIPSGQSLMFLPQKPYLPLGSLREVLEYPGMPRTLNELQKALEEVGLASFKDRLDEVNDWARILSLGEQQRIAILRVLLSAPEWLLLDEATSAVDEASQLHLYQLLKARLPNMTLISIAHRESLKAHHTQEIYLGVGQESALEIAV